MIRTTRIIDELRCRNCNIIHLRGETFQGQRCCDKPSPRYLGRREVPQYKKTIEEEKAEVAYEIKKASGNE